MIPFQIKGAQAEWRMVYDHLTTLEVGVVVTYDELTDVLGRDFLSSRAPFYAAQANLERECKRTLECVTGVGYRVVTAGEHEGLARRHHRRSRKQLGKSLSKLHSADRAALTSAQRERVDRLEERVQNQADALRRLDSRVGRVERAVVKSRELQKAAVVSTQSQIDKLRDAMRRGGFDVE